MIIILPLLGLFVITLLAMWKTHVKIGLPGWSGIVPIYNYFLRSKIVDMQNSFDKLFKLMIMEWVVLIIGALAATIITGITLILSYKVIVSDHVDASVGIFLAERAMCAVNGMAMVIVGIYCLFAMMMAICMIKIDSQIVKGFRKKKWFAIGMVLFPFVFYPVLAWGNAQWALLDSATNTSDWKY